MTPEQPNNHTQTNIVVKSIDVYGIKDRLRKAKTKESKEALQLIKVLQNALERQQQLTGVAISKIREQALEISNLKKQL